MQVILTGHSLGGSCALIVAALLKDALRVCSGEARVVLSVVTFGCPRTGDSAFGKHLMDNSATDRRDRARLVEVRHYRVQNELDPLTLFPAFFLPRCLIGPYAHAPGQHIWIKGERLLLSGCPTGADDWRGPTAATSIAWQVAWSTRLFFSSAAAFVIAAVWALAAFLTASHRDRKRPECEVEPSEDRARNVAISERKRPPSCLHYIPASVDPRSHKMGSELGYVSKLLHIADWHLSPGDNGDY